VHRKSNPNKISDKSLKLGLSYRQQCCACTREKEKLCNLCQHRQDHAALFARDTMATVHYTQDNLVYHAPWDTTEIEVPDTVTRLMVLQFKPNYFDHRREFSRNDRKQFTCCSFTKLVGSVCCNSGEHTYYQVKIVEPGGVMRFRWKSGGSRWLFI